MQEEKAKSQCTPCTERIRKITCSGQRIFSLVFMSGQKHEEIGKRDGKRREEWVLRLRE